MSAPIADRSLDGVPLSEALRHPLLTRAQEQQLAARAVRGDRAARETLVRHNLRLVAAVARKYAGPGVPVTDLFQDGVTGLLRAVDRFELGRGTRFSTYATWWIRAAISEATRRYQPIPPPREIEMHRRRALAAGSREDADGEEELRRRTGLSPAQWREARNAQEVQRLVPIDAPSSKALEDRTAAATEELAWTSVRRHHAERLLASLPSLERDVLRLRFGFDDGIERSHREIGERVGRSRETIRKLERRLLAALPSRPEAAALRDDAEAPA